MGTPWITQRGIDQQGIDELGDIIADLLEACVPYSLTGRIRPLARAKVDFDALQDASQRVSELVSRLGIDTDAAAAPSAAGDAIDVSGGKAQAFLHGALTSQVDSLAVGKSQPTTVLERDGALMAAGELRRTGEDSYQLLPASNSERVKAWLHALSDGYVLLDEGDPSVTLPGPVRITVGQADRAGDPGSHPKGEIEVAEKAHFVGIQNLPDERAALPAFDPAIASVDMLQETPLHSLHAELGAKMAPFAGWEMPLWYKSVSAEHAAVRESAGIFDVAHMGILEISGAGAARFLHYLTTNDVLSLRVGRSQYSFLLDVDGGVLDDLLVYRLAAERFLAVVNAGNSAKVWAWLKAAHAGEVMLDRDFPARRIENRERVQLRDLRVTADVGDRRALIALQGPRSRDILLQLLDSNDHAQVRGLAWSGIMTTRQGWQVSRTGYTGERVAYELFVPPQQAADIFQQLIDLGAAPCGLAARDSLRIEAGLPLYGHELAGELGLNPADAGFGSFVKLYKPFFVGKRAFIKSEGARKHQVSRFALDARGGRPAQQGDPVVNARGRVVGTVTSCAADAQGNQVGLALMDSGSRKVGTRLEVYAGSARTRGIDASRTSIGTRLPVPQPLTIQPAFKK